MADTLSETEFRTQLRLATSQTQGIAAGEPDFYVPIDDPGVRGVDLCQRLHSIVTFTVGPAVTLVTGPRGSGKTSDLLRFGDQLRDRPFLYADIEDVLRPNEPIDAGRLLISIVALLVKDVARGKGDAHKVPDARSFLDRLKSALGRLRIDGFDITLGGDTGPASLDVTMRASLADSDDVRRQVQQAMKNARAEFRREMFDIIGELSRALTTTPGRLPVLVVDSLDHLRGQTDPAAINSYRSVRESVEALFADFGDELRLPGFHVVYCVPSYVHCSWAGLHDMLNIKTITERGDLFPPGLSALERVLRARVPHGETLERLIPDRRQLETVLVNSGGSFRDLFRLLEAVIFNAPQAPATDASIAGAVAEYRRQFMGGPSGLNREQVEILAQVAADSQYIPTGAQQADFEFLETLGAILRYPDGPSGYWLGVHPLLRDIIARVHPGAA